MPPYKPPKSLKEESQEVFCHFLFKRLLLRFQRLNPSEEESIFAYLKNVPSELFREAFRKWSGWKAVQPPDSLFDDASDRSQIIRYTIAAVSTYIRILINGWAELTNNFDLYRHKYVDLIPTIILMELSPFCQTLIEIS